MAYVASGELNMGTLGPMVRRSVQSTPNRGEISRERGGASIEIAGREAAPRSSSKSNATPPPPAAAIDETEFYIVVNYGQGGNYNAIITLLGNLCFFLMHI